MIPIVLRYFAFLLLVLLVIANKVLFVCDALTPWELSLFDILWMLRLEQEFLQFSW